MHFLYCNHLYKSLLQQYHYQVIIATISLIPPPRVNVTAHCVYTSESYSSPFVNVCMVFMIVIVCDVCVCLCVYVCVVLVC